MLRGIPEIISPDLMKALMEMGHGDEITFGDVNFPSVSKSTRYVSARGFTVSQLLDAVLRFFPLDSYSQGCAFTMDPHGFFQENRSPVWNEYRMIIRKHDRENAFREFQLLDAPEFYERAKNSFVTVATSEVSAYGCIILRKGAIV